VQKLEEGRCYGMRQQYGEMKMQAELEKKLTASLLSEAPW
jgi:hypothetical protein